MVHTLAHSRRQLATIVVAVGLLLACLGLSSVAEARAQRRASAAQRLRRDIQRCQRLRRRHRGCGRSARLRRRQRTHRKGSRHAPVRGIEAPAATPTPPSAPTPVSAPGANGEACPNTELIPTSANIAQVREATVCLINEQREQHGELALAENSKLNTAAQGHSEDMVARNYFEHTTPTGEEFQTRITASGYVPRGAAYELGENIDMATFNLATPAATVTAWMNSPEHRANILNGEFRETGMGVAAAAPAYFAEGASGATYTQDFGVLAS